MEKYGFVYIWYDRKHKRYYIGCHWGHENDGYICSSTWMKNAYRRRPEDFKRRVISRVYSSRKDLIDKEYEWLQLISEVQLGKDYYNLTRYRNGHWTTCPDSYKSVQQKNSEAMKRNHQDPEYRKIYDAGRKRGNEKYKQTLKDNPEILEKKSKSMKATMAKKFPAETRMYPIAKRDPNTGELTEGYRLRHKQGIERYYSDRPIEDTIRRSKQAKTTVGFYKSNSRTGKKNSEQHNKAIQEANGIKVMIEGTEFVSMSEAGRHNGVSQAAVRYRCNSPKWPEWYVIE